MELCNEPPTLYQHYTAGGITSGLSVNQSYFTLNDKNITLYGGAMHYFRVPKAYWRDRIRKMKYAGLNTVETYVPWNLHEPQPGSFDFGEGGSDMQNFLDLQTYMKIIQEEDMLAIVRPGPFICAEFEFGGMPSWLLREPDVKLRTADEVFMKHVTRYFNTLLTLLAAFQFTLGGPIIAFQVENEYGSTENATFKPDLNYVEQLRQLFLSNNIKELLFTSDSPFDHGALGTLPELFQTANFNKNPERQFDKLKELQGNKPIMAMEYWSGWFNHWSEEHYVGRPANFRDIYERILKYPASVNLYMFHGGTSWGFLNGANMQSQETYMPDITSYDYNAPLTENGNYTEKYFIVKELIEKYSSTSLRLKKIEQPAAPVSKAYPTLPISKCINYSAIVEQLPYKLLSSKLQPMELIPINNNTGQQFGYIIYRKTNIDLPENSVLKVEGYVYDTLMVYLNNELVSQPLQSSKDLDGFGYWRHKDGTLDLNNAAISNATIDLVVENLGRNNFGSLELFQQFKGLRDNVLLNELVISEWEIMPMEFKSKWTNGLNNWSDFEEAPITNGSALYWSNFQVEEAVDTFLDMQQWTKGIVIINGFVLGRYMKIGPQQSLYLPAPLLRIGDNDLVIFEQFEPGCDIRFADKPIYFTQ